MRSLMICATSLAVVVVALGACNDGSEGIVNAGSAGSTSTGTSGASSVGAESSTGGSASPTGGSGVVPSGGSTVANAGTDSTGTAGSSVAMGGSGGGGPVATGGSAGTPAAGGSGGGAATGLRTGPFKILVMASALEFPHDSIGACNTMLDALGKGEAPERAAVAGLAADATWTVDRMLTDPKAANYFNEITAENLAKYDIVYFNNPTGPVFTNAPDGANKKKIFQTWFENGGGWAGQHSATDFEKDNRWTWFMDNVAGGWFVDHDGPTTPGTISAQPQFANHPIVKAFVSPWNVQEEWYKMNRDPEGVPGFKVLAKVSVTNTSLGNTRPAIWINENAKGGRSFYTIRGHSQSAYAEPQFRALMLRGLLWSAHRLPG